MKTIQSSVAFTDPQNNVLANGFIIFQLSGPAKVISGGGLILQNIQAVVTLTGGGLVPNATQIFANDELQPTGTYYTVRFYNSKNSLVRGPENWILSGASPIDLSQVTNVSVPDPGLGNPVLQNPSAAQSITGQALTLSSSVPFTVQGTETHSGAATFSNIVLNGANQTNSVNLLNVQGAVGSITGNSSAQTVYTYSLPANTVASPKGIRITFSGNHTGSASVTWGITLNGQTVFSQATTGSSLSIQSIVSASTSTTGATASWLIAGTSVSGDVRAPGSLAWTSSQTLNLTFSVANTDSVTGNLFMVELIQ